MNLKEKSKTEIAREIVARLGEGGHAALKNGTLRIDASEVDGKYLWKKGDREPDVLDAEGVVKRLQQQSKAALVGDFEIFATPEAREDAIEQREDDVRERVNKPKASGATRSASANPENKRRPTGDSKKRESAEDRLQASVAELGEGWTIKAGADIKPGEVTIIDPERGPERLVESVEGMSKGRPRLKIRLAQVDDAEKIRRRKLSPYKQYAVKIDDGADDEATESDEAIESDEATTDSE